MTGFTSPNPPAGPKTDATMNAGPLIGSDPIANHQPVTGTDQPPAKSPEPAQCGRPVTTPRRAASRILVMASVFVIGALAGVSGAWWMHRDADAAQDFASSEPAQASARIMQKPPQGERGVALRGISPHELPYDGIRPSPPDSGQQSPETPAPIRSQEAVAASSAQGMPEPEATQERTPPSPEPPSENEVQEIAKETSEPDPAIPVAAQKPSAKSTSHAKRKTSGGDAKEQPKRQTTPRLAKDKEIERIRQQADQELQRKLEVSRAAEAARARKQAARNSHHQQAAMRASREARVRKIFAKCERNPNFFRREQCKWKLCAGMWGKDGCPSYPRQANSY